MIRSLQEQDLPGAEEFRSRSIQERELPGAGAGASRNRSLQEQERPGAGAYRSRSFQEQESPDENKRRSLSQHEDAEVRPQVPSNPPSQRQEAAERTNAWRSLQTKDVQGSPPPRRENPALDSEQELPGAGDSSIRSFQEQEPIERIRRPSPSQRQEAAERTKAWKSLQTEDVQLHTAVLIPGSAPSQDSGQLGLFLIASGFEFFNEKLQPSLPPVGVKSCPAAEGGAKFQERLLHEYPDPLEPSPWCPPLPQPKSSSLAGVVNFK